MTGFEVLTASLRGVHVAASLSLFGCMVFRVFVVPRREAADLPLTGVTRIAGVSGLIALIVGVFWSMAVAAAIAGADSLTALWEAMPAVALHTAFGRLVCLRLVLLTGVLVSLAYAGESLMRTVALYGSGVAVALQPLLGHAGAVAGNAGTVLVLIEMAHLLAAGAWLGGLSPLMLCVSRAPPAAAAMLCERFTPIGLVAVGTIAVTALPQAAELIGSISGLFGTTYGHIALIKIGLFFLALGLAAANRLVFTAWLGEGRGEIARRSLIASVAVEAVAGLCIVLAAAAMASSSPASHTQPVWPFAWRPSLVAWDEPELRDELLRLLMASAAGLVLIVASQVKRRRRIMATVLAAAVVAPFLPALELLLVEAYPSSYATSPTGFSVNAIVRGQTLFARHCAGCHDAQNGTNGAADLTAPHLWEHLDGELFWWLTNGIADPRGVTLMPAFGPIVSEDGRWALIDFIHARNVGAQVRTAGQWSPPIPAPATPVSCAGGDASSIADLRGRVLWIAAGGGPEKEAAPDEPGVTTIRLARGPAAAPGENECAAAAAEAWDAWALLAGVAPERFAGYHAVVDGQGWLRAWLPPEADAVRVAAAIRDARDRVIEGAGVPASGHHH
jgi:putative copper export protein/mono/diheme cytochrome c family protein